MDVQIIFLYCLCDELLNAMHHTDDSQCQMTTAEIMTFAITAALFFNGNFARTRLFFLAHKYFSTVISKSRINKRIHAVKEDIWLKVFHICRAFLQNPKCKEFIIDSFPVPSCHNARTWRCKLFPDKKFHGYCASKKTFFWGLKVHMLVSKEGIPIEFIFTAGSEADIVALKRFNLDLPDTSRIYGDKAYTSYDFEDFLKEMKIELIPQRRRNLKRQHSGTISYLQKINRKRIETVFSCITRYMPRHIHAVTPKGFILKLLLFILAFSTDLCVP